MKSGLIIPGRASRIPTDPYFSSVTLLLHGDGVDAATTFTDSSQYKYTATRTATAEIDTAQSKFGGSSIYFTGGGRLSFANIEHLRIGNGDFTLECFVRFASLPGAGNAAYLFQKTDEFELYQHGSSGLSFYLGTGGAVIGLTAAAGFATDTWYHVAVCRSGTTVRMFVDGVQVTSGTTSGSVSGTTNPLCVASVTGSNALNGWIDELRITKGVARYTAAFSPPTAASPDGTVTTDAYYSSVSLLLHGDGTDASTTFTDDSPLAQSPTSITGDAQIDTAQYKFGTASMLFDGTGDYINYGADTDFAFGTGDFTVEGWFRFNALSTWHGIFQTGAQSGGNGSFHLRIASGTKYVNILFENGPSMDVYGSTVLTTGVWHHIAVTRANGVFRIFVNGALDLTHTPATLTISAPNVIVGAQNNGTWLMNGWIDDFRVTKGVARYTAAFDVPTAAFPNS